MPPTKRAKLDPNHLKPSRTLYINNLNDQLSKSVLRHNLYIICSTYGDVVEINLKLRGQAHVVFSSVINASVALKCLNGEDFFGKPMGVKYSWNVSKVVETQALTEIETV